MRAQNGYGSVYKLTGNRRKPYVAIVTVRTVYDAEKDKYILKRKPLGYFATQSEARRCLAEYNESPCLPDLINITVEQIWKEILPKLENELSKSRLDGYTSAFKYMMPIHQMRIRDVKTVHLQRIINDCDKKSATKQNIKTVMSKIYEYAMQNDFVSKDYSEYIKFEKDAVSIKRELFSSEDVELLWKNQGIWYIDMILVLLYTGMRINEFLSTKVENVHITDRYIYLPRDIVKNDSSERDVPIHERIVPIIKRFQSYGSEYLAVKPTKNRIIYKNYMDRENKLLTELLGCKHTPHDTRHTFITMARECGCNNLVIQRIVGHSPDTITETVYTHLKMEELLDEINKIEYC